LQEVLYPPVKPTRYPELSLINSTRFNEEFMNITGITQNPVIIPEGNCTALNYNDSFTVYYCPNNGENKLKDLEDYWLDYNKTSSLTQCVRESLCRQASLLHCVQLLNQSYYHKYVWGVNDFVFFSDAEWGINHFQEYYCKKH